MEPVMTKDEIISSWKNAISAKKQVGILAELNACPKSEIVRILYEGGVLSGQSVYQYRKSGLLPPATEADMTEEFEKKVAAAGVPGEDKKNRCAECLFFERGDIDMDGMIHGTCYNDRVLDVLANSPACGSTYIRLVHPSSAFLPWWLWGWHVECQKCYHRGKKKLFMRRAVKSWNKEKRK